MIGCGSTGLTDHRIPPLRQAPLVVGNFSTTMKKSLTTIIVIGLNACNQSHPSEQTKTMDFGAFTIKTPHTWKQIKAKGIDSYVGTIAIDDSDILDFDLGWYSNDLTEYQEIKMGDGKMYYISASDTAYSPTLVDSAHRDRVVKSNVSWDTIDGRRAKVLKPIKPGVGTIGIYIDSLWQAGADVDKFNLYGTNLKPQNEKVVLDAFKTLKFHKD